jgi:predicted DNA-binding transcriptional regulator AlpA
LDWFPRRFPVPVIDRLLTAREVGERLRYSTETILRWYRRGEFEGVARVMPDGAVRFPENLLEHWLEERATTARGSATHPAGRRPAATLTVATHPDDREEV